MIDNRFLFFNSRDAFEEKLEAEEIRKDAIAFIKGPVESDRAIWTHGTYFSSNAGSSSFKGFFNTYLDLIAAVPYPHVGDMAVVSSTGATWRFNHLLPAGFTKNGTAWYYYVCNQDGIWTKTDKLYEYENVNAARRLAIMQLLFSRFATKDELNTNFATKAELEADFITNDALARKDFLTSTNIKTINGQSIIGSGDIVIDQTQISPQISNSSELFDQTLNKYLDVINGDIYNKISSLSSTVNQMPIQHMLLMETTIQQLQSRIAEIEESAEQVDYIYMVFLTLELYDSLEQYNDDTLYFIVESSLSDTWGFGDSFDVTLSSDTWGFGDSFDITLSSESDSQNNPDEDVLDIFPVTLT